MRKRNRIGVLHGFTSSNLVGLICAAVGVAVVVYLLQRPEVVGRGDASLHECRPERRGVSDRHQRKVPLMNERGEVVWEDEATVKQFAEARREKAKLEQLYAQLDERGREVWRMAAEDFQRLAGHTSPWVWTSAKPRLEGHSANWMLRDFKPYVILVEKSPKYSAEVRAEETGAILHDFQTVFLAAYGKNLNGPALDKQVVSVVVYKDTESYLRQSGVAFWKETRKLARTPENAKFLDSFFLHLHDGGHYNPAKRELVLANDLPDFYNEVFHIAVHVLLDVAGQSGGKLVRRYFWFEEGLATNWEEFYRDKNTGEFSFGVLAELPNWRCRDVVQKMVRRKTHRRFDGMLGRSWAETAEGSMAEQYLEDSAQAWSMVYFLYWFDNGKYRAKFEEYFAAEMAGEGGREAFARIVGDPEVLEKEWLQYVPTISPR